MAVALDWAVSPHRLRTSIAAFPRRHRFPAHGRNPLASKGAEDLRKRAGSAKYPAKHAVKLLGLNSIHTGVELWCEHPLPAPPAAGNSAGWAP